AFQSSCHVESHYYCIRVIDLAEQIGIPARSMVLDHLEHGVNVRDRAGLLLSPYVEAQDRLAQLHTDAGSTFRAFFIGGGAYTLPRAWLSQRPDTVIHVAEVDPAVTRMAQSHMWLKADDRLTVVHADARRALNAMQSGAFDVVVGDAFHDIAVPQHLVTSEFFSLVHDRLAPRGIYLMNVVDHLERPRLVLSIVKSLETRFPVVEVWRSNWSGSRATFVIAGLRTATSVSRLRSAVTPGQTFDRLSSGQIARLAKTLEPIELTDDYAPVDRLIAVR
ncbi:MAG: fused MFS/spermidine synthase, partial [Hyphomicrobiaceae bacterium]